MPTEVTTSAPDGESALQSAPGGGVPADVGLGPVAGDTSFALPDDFDTPIDDGIELPDESQQPSGGGGSPPDPGATQGQQPPAGQQQQQPPPGPAPGQQQQPQPAASQPPQAQPQAGDGSTERRIYSPAELAQALGQNRVQMIDALAQQKFALTPQEIQALEVDAVGVLPKIMARVYYEATVNGLQQIANMVPRMVENVVTTRIGETAAEDTFHNAWPNIDKANPQHMQAVSHFAQAFRSMNPNASQSDAIKFVGTAVTNYFGLQMPQAGQQRQNGGAPQRGNGVAQRRGGVAFTPATGGGAQPPLVVATAPRDPFAGLAANYDEG